MVGLCEVLFLPAQGTHRMWERLTYDPRNSTIILEPVQLLETLPQPLTFPEWPELVGNWREGRREKDYDFQIALTQSFMHSLKSD